MTTRTEGVEQNYDDSIDGAANAFLSRWEDAEKPSEEGDNESDLSEDQDIEDDVGDEGGESGPEDSEDTDGGEDDNSDEDAGSPPELEASDDHKVTVTVDGETKSVTVKELKRLFGQEAALTRKSQEVAAARKAAELDSERFVVASNRMLEKAEARFAPYAGIDWMVAQQRLTPDEFAALRTEAREAHSDLEFLKAETNDVLTQIQNQRQAALQTQAAETIATLERDIQGWNQELYNKVREFALSQGMTREAVNGIVDAPTLKVLHEAMRYSEAREKAKLKKAKQRSAPKRVVKPASGTSEGLIRPKDKGAESLARLSKTGSRDDAAQAFLSRWADSDA